MSSSSVRTDYGLEIGGVGENQDPVSSCLRSWGLEMATIHRFHEFKTEFSYFGPTMQFMFLDGPSGEVDPYKEIAVMLDYQVRCPKMNVPVVDYLAERALNDDEMQTKNDLWLHTPQRVTQQYHDLLNDKDPRVQKLVKRYLWDYHRHPEDNSQAEIEFSIDYNKWCPTGRQPMFEYLRQLDELICNGRSGVSKLVSMYLLGRGGKWKGDPFMSDYEMWRSKEKRSMLLYLQEISSVGQPWPAGALSVLTTLESEERVINEMYYEMRCDSDVPFDSD